MSMLIFWPCNSIRSQGKFLPSEMRKDWISESNEILFSFFLLWRHSSSGELKRLKKNETYEVPLSVDCPSRITQIKAKNKTVTLSWEMDTENMFKINSSVIKQERESLSGCFKKTNHAKFSEKRYFLPPDTLCVYVGVSNVHF